MVAITAQVGSLTPEKSIPDAILKQAKGLAILSIAKVGMMVTYNVGTGIVVARREDGSWSPPSAISSFGIGWGAQVKYVRLCCFLRSYSLRISKDVFPPFIDYNFL